MSADAPKRSGEEPAAKAGGSFPHAGRLLKHADFDRVYKQGRRHFSSHMTVFYLPQAEGPSSTQGSAPEKSARVGFTVGKVLGGAVVRNRIKRRLREAVRLRRSVLKGVDVVINPKKSVLTLEFSVVLEEVGRALDVIAKKLMEREK
ncbi:MAG TPA: ribonuclease P protein component [Terriglobales bacterium]|nr:ribonuclease P protein component [Terriglobales bacterium]